LTIHPFKNLILQKAKRGPARHPNELGGKAKIKWGRCPHLHFGRGFEIVDVGWE
jgi:hypothetical protein